MTIHRITRSEIRPGIVLVAVSPRNDQGFHEQVEGIVESADSHVVLEHPVLSFHALDGTLVSRDTTYDAISIDPIARGVEFYTSEPGPNQVCPECGARDGHYTKCSER